MQKRIAKGKRRDINEIAAEIVRLATTESAPPSKKSAAGRISGKRGGTARAAKLTAEQRREIAKRAARARWSKD